MKPTPTAPTHTGRRDFVKLLGTAGLFAAAGGGATLTRAQPPAPAPAEPSGPLIDGTPAVYAPADDSATIIWTISQPARGWVEYGTDPANLNQRSGGDAFGFTPHHERVLKVRLKNLAPGTRYWWRAASIPLPQVAANASLSRLSPEPPPVHTAVYSFTTLSPTAPETRFAVWNDTHSRKETLISLAALTTNATAPQPDFLVWNGDICQNNHNDPTLLPDIHVHPHGIVDLAKGPPIFMSRGNHDIRGLWASKVNDYVDFPDTHENRVSRPFYAFRSGPLAAILLDTGEDKPDAHPSFRGLPATEPLIAEQARWLEKIIERPDMKNAPVKIVFSHMPLRWTNEQPQDYWATPAGFDRFSKRGRDAWHASLVKWGARVVISGHVHRWTHIPADNRFPYAQITGAGPEPERALLIRGHATSSGKLTLTALDTTGREAHSVTL